MENEINLLSKQIEKDFEIEPKTNLTDLKDALTQILVYLLLNDIERLWGILYRIDVSEYKVKALFNLKNAKEIAPALADLIIERQLQKVESRKKYKQ